MKMDCFAAKVCLRDQTKILIGGLCISGVVPELLRRCRKLEDGTLPVDTVVGIDRAMAQMLDTLQMEGVRRRSGGFIAGGVRTICKSRMEDRRCNRDSRNAARVCG